MRRLALLVALLALLALPGAALAAPPAEKPASPEKPAKPQKPAVPKATVKIDVGDLNGGLAPIFDQVPVTGTLSPYAPGQRVEVTFYLNGHRLVSHKVAVAPGPNGTGTFESSVILRTGGKYAVSAHHAATAVLGGDSTVRKSWNVSYPKLKPGECGKVVEGFKTAMAKMGYVSGGGDCFNGRLGREVLAYRKVNDMDRTSKAGPGVVTAVFNGKGGYQPKYPGAGEHAEVSLARSDSGLTSAAASSSASGRLLSFEVAEVPGGRSMARSETALSRVVAWLGSVQALPRVTCPVTEPPASLIALTSGETSSLFTPGSEISTTDRPTSWLLTRVCVSWVMKSSRCCSEVFAVSSRSCRVSFSCRRLFTESVSELPIGSLSGPAPSTMPTASARNTETSETR